MDTLCSLLSGYSGDGVLWVIYSLVGFFSLQALYSALWLYDTLWEFPDSFVLSRVFTLWGALSVCYSLYWCPSTPATLYSLWGISYL